MRPPHLICQISKVVQQGIENRQYPRRLRNEPPKKRAYESNDQHHAEKYEMRTDLTSRDCSLYAVT